MRGSEFTTLVADCHLTGTAWRFCTTYVRIVELEVAIAVKRISVASSIIVVSQWGFRNFDSPLSL